MAILLQICREVCFGPEAHFAFGTDVWDRLMHGARVTKAVNDPEATALAGADAAAQKLGTVGQTLGILRFLATVSRPIGVNAIARELGMAPSSCFKILKQLHQEDFAEFDEDSKCYSLGSGAVLLARRALDPANTYSLIRPMLEEFAATHDVALGFWRRISEDRIVLAGFVERQSMMRIHMTVGQRLPMLIGAVGRAFAAEMAMSDATLERAFLKLRWQSPITFEEYRAQVDQCRADGYAIDQNNFSPGVTTTATAFGDAQGAVSNGLSAIRFSTHTPLEQMQELGQNLMRLTQELNRRWLAR